MFQLIIFFLCSLIIKVNGQLDCCKQQYPTRMTVQSIIKQPLPLIVNSQVMDEMKSTETQPESDNNNSNESSDKSLTSTLSPSSSIKEQSKKSMSKINSYEMIPMIESADWSDYPNYQPSSYPPNNQPTYHRYDYNRFSPYHPSGHHYQPPSLPPIPHLPSHPIHHSPFDFPDLSSSSKSHVEEVALFIVVLTIAGLFGLVIAMMVPFILLLQSNKATLVSTVPTNQSSGSSQGLIGKRKKRNLIESLQILKSIHETSQRYQH